MSTLIDRFLFRSITLVIAMITIERSTKNRSGGWLHMQQSQKIIPHVCSIYHIQKQTKANGVDASLCPI